MKPSVRALIPLLAKRPLYLVFATAFFSLTIALAVSALGYTRMVYEGYSYMYGVVLGHEGGIVVGSASISPFTSIVDPEVLEERLRAVENVTVEYYFITLAYVYGKPVAVLGDPLVDGHCVFLGEDVYRDIVDSGAGFVPVYSPFTDEVVFLRLCGPSLKPYTVVNHSIATRIRGVSSKFWTHAVIKPSNPEAFIEVYRALGVESGFEGLLARVLVLLERAGGNLTARAYSDFSDVYLSRISIPRDYLLYSSYAIVVVSVLGAPLVGYGFALYLERTLRALEIIGVSRRALVPALYVVSLLSLVSGSLVAYCIVNAIPGIRVLGFTLEVGVSPLNVVTVSIPLFALYATGIAWGLRREQG